MAVCLELREEYKRLETDAQHEVFTHLYCTHPVILAGWDRCMKKGIMPVRNEEEAKDLLLLMFAHADYCEEIGCPAGAHYWRTGEGEGDLPRSKWMSAFIRKYS